MKTATIVLSGAIVALSTAAFAHASLEEKQATIGGSYKASVLIGHGCDGQATHTVRVTIPEGFYNVKPMPKPGWTLETVTGAYEKPYVSHGNESTEGVKEIIWSDGALEDAWFDTFVFRGSFGADLAPGEFFFPTVQTCADGELAWTDTTGGDGEPAPKLMLVAGESDSHAGHGATMDAAMAGDLVISGQYIRETPPNAPVAGGYLTIENKGEDDRLVGISSDIAGMVQIHESVEEGGIAKMRELENGLALPSGETVELASGGYHLMFMQLKGSVKDGDMVNVTLTFEKAGDVSVMFPVKAMGDMGGHSGH
jgi:periplasmic copper chaperone A